MTAACDTLSFPRRLSRAICRAATGKAVLVSLFSFMATAAIISGRPFGLARLQEITGGPTIPDMTFTTGPDSVYAVLAALGDAGLTFYLTHIVPLDLVFPFTYGLFLALGISWSLTRLLPEGSPWLILNLAPVLAAAADYCENAGVITLLLAYPARMDPVAWLVSAMYVIKFAFSAVSYLTLFAALAGCAAMFLLRRTGRSPA